MQPQVIGFVMDKEGNTNTKGSNEALVNLIQAVKKTMQQANPFLVVFNCTIGSKDMQERLQYDHIMTTETELSVPILLKMAELFQKKMDEAFTKTKSTEKENIIDRVYLKKTNSASIAEILKPIKVLKLSETDLVFQSEYPFPAGMNLHLSSPIDMFINVQPTKNQGKVPEYQGYIHCLGEGQKKDLRRYVNAVFFRDHDAIVNAEADEFNKLNETKLNEKQEAAKKALEEVAKDASSDEETKT